MSTIQLLLQQQQQQSTAVAVQPAAHIVNPRVPSEQLQALELEAIWESLNNDDGATCVAQAKAAPPPQFHGRQQRGTLEQAMAEHRQKQLAALGYGARAGPMAPPTSTRQQLQLHRRQQSPDPIDPQDMALLAAEAAISQQQVHELMMQSNGYNIGSGMPDGFGSWILGSEDVMPL